MSLVTYDKMDAFEREYERDRVSDVQFAHDITVMKSANKLVHIGDGLLALLMVLEV